MIKLTKPLKENESAVGSEVAEVRKLLSSVGLYTLPVDPHAPWVESDLATAIKNYQEMRELNADGVANPDGETVRDFNKFSDLIQTAGRSPRLTCAKCGAKIARRYLQ